MTLLCLASYEKGHEFLRQAKRNGARVLLVTSQSLKDKAQWPLESIDETFYVPDVEKEWKMETLLAGVNWLARTEQIDRVVALDDFDVEKAAMLREHLRVSGMGETTARYFRDKLAMRAQALETGIRVPRFVHTLNHARIRGFLSETSPPYVLKPRKWAGAIGIRKIASADELWKALDALAEKQSVYLLEEFIPGSVYHIDSLVSGNEVLFAAAHRYGIPPMEVAHEGRVFSSLTLPHGSRDERALMELNRSLLMALGLRQGVSHTEFIKAGAGGEFYFLETSCRVGGANIVELVEAESGLNMWAEWANIETAEPGKPYSLPEHRNEYAALLICLARQETPDMSMFSDAEIFWRLTKRHHAGLIVKSPDRTRVETLVADYTQRFYDLFFTSQPPRDRPMD